MYVIFVEICAFFVVVLLFLAFSMLVSLIPIPGMNLTVAAMSIAFGVWWMWSNFLHGKR